MRVSIKGGVRKCVGSFGGVKWVKDKKIESNNEGLKWDPIVAGRGRWMNMTLSVVLHRERKTKTPSSHQYLSLYLSPNKKIKKT